MYGFIMVIQSPDEPAFELLKDGNIQECSDIWVKLMASGEVKQKEIVLAYHNLSTLLLRNLIY